MSIYIKDIPIESFLDCITDDMLTSGSPLDLHFTEFDTIKDIYYKDLPQIEVKDQNEFIRTKFIDSIEDKWHKSPKTDLDAKYIEYSGLIGFLDTYLNSKESEEYLYNRDYIATTSDMILIKNSDDLTSKELIDNIESKYTSFILDPNWRVHNILEELDKSSYRKILDYQNNFTDDELYQETIRKEFRIFDDNNLTSKILIPSYDSKKPGYIEDTGMTKYDIMEFIFENIESRFNGLGTTKSLDDIWSISNSYLQSLFKSAVFDIQELSNDGYTVYINADNLKNFLTKDSEDDGTTLLTEWKVI